MHIHVFKTNISTLEKRNAVQSLLNSHHAIIKWNIDKWDDDNILRIEALHENSNEFIHCIGEAGFDIQLLED
ncbi:MAG: hypothetical protein R2852_05700 [Bacteroidia bacterium]